MNPHYDAIQIPISTCTVIRDVIGFDRAKAWWGEHTIITSLAIVALMVGVFAGGCAIAHAAGSHFPQALGDRIVENLTPALVDIFAGTLLLTWLVRKVRHCIWGEDRWNSGLKYLTHTSSRHGERFSLSRTAFRVPIALAALATFGYLFAYVMHGVGPSPQALATNSHFYIPVAILTATWIVVAITLNGRQEKQIGQASDSYAQSTERHRQRGRTQRLNVTHVPTNSPTQGPSRPPATQRVLAPDLHDLSVFTNPATQGLSRPPAIQRVLAPNPHDLSVPTNPATQRPPRPSAIQRVLPSNLHNLSVTTNPATQGPPRPSATQQVLAPNPDDLSVFTQPNTSRAALDPSDDSLYRSVPARSVRRSNRNSSVLPSNRNSDIDNKHQKTDDSVVATNARVQQGPITLVG